MKTITQLIVAILIAWAPVQIARATDNPNPCGDKEICIKVPGVNQDCFKVCCGQKNKIVEDDDGTTTQDCSCDAGEFCQRIRGKEICLDSVQLETYRAHKAKRAAAAHRARQKAKLADLESKAAELEKVKGDVEATRLAHLQMLQSQATLLSDTEGWAREELTEAKKVLEDNQKHHDDMKLNWLKLRDDITAFEKYLAETHDPAKTRATTIISNPDMTKDHPELLTDSITELQTVDATLSTMTSALIASREMIWKAEEKDVKAELKRKVKEIKKLKRKAKKPKHFEVSGGTTIIMTDDKKTMSGGQLSARYRFLDGVFQPTLGLRLAMGQFPNSRFYNGVLGELGAYVRVHKNFELVFLGHGGGYWGFYKSTGSGPAAGARGGIVIRFNQESAITLAYNYEGIIPMKNTETYSDSWKYSSHGFVLEFNGGIF
ncbi:hypothetical protein HOG17_02835 [Candidatus Peregrinibacteria bacterium]|jgi:hypothetical protein|nr:hypothetical protein [Candidatus Peregrinibacteria bacterium]